MINSISITQKIKQHYTMVEMLAVIGLMAIVMAIGSAAINAIITKRGVNGGVSMVGAQVNLARSVAVAKNHYIALLLPAPDYNRNPESSSNTNTRLKDRFLTSMRLCYVKRSTDFLGSGHHDINYSTGFVFSDWVEDHYWVDLPSKVCANIVDRYDEADPSRTRYDVINISRVPAGSSTSNCYAVIFNPSGSLVSGRNALIQVYPGVIKSNGGLDMIGLGGSAWRDQDKGKLKNRRWCVEINRFTGRIRTSYAQVEK